MQTKLLKSTYLMITILFIVCAVSCKTPEGCEAADKYRSEVENLDSANAKRGNSNLFSKKQRKKMKTRGQK